jgi:DNA invertase Pin-like site-specific DNA recombinase
MKALRFLGNRVEDAANAFTKLSKKDLILIFKLKAKGLYYKDIAKRLGVSVGTIGRVINKKSYRDENIDRKR